MRANEAYEFKSGNVDNVVRFFSALKHFKGKHAGKPFELEPWQQFVIACIYGFVFKGTNTRVVTSVYLDMSRKNGKTAFAAGLSLYHLVYDGESGAEVDLAANSKEQAKIAFDFCDKFRNTLDPKAQVLKPYRDSIRMNITASIINVFAADDSKLDGYNASMFLLDEYHAAKNSKLFDVLKSSQGMREQPIGMIITTAGFDKTGPCYKKRETSIEILSQLKENDRQFDMIYTLDEDDEWDDPKVWGKCAPNLGVTISKQWMRDTIDAAKRDASQEVGVKTKTLNLWVDSEQVWIPSNYINACSRDIPIEEFKGKDIYFGIDLASTSDLTCLTAMFISDDNRPVMKTFYYLPNDAIASASQKLKYDEWAAKGLLIYTPGNVTDYDFILNQLMEFYEIGNVVRVGYDQWNSTQFVIKATNAGLPMVPYSQAIGNFNKPTKEIERLILSDGVDTDNNEITRWCFSNVSIKRDHNDNEKPGKDKSDNKIDGVISMIEAIGIWMETPQYSVEI